MLASMLDCNVEQKAVMGLASSSAAFTPEASQKLSDMWIDFLVKEADI